MPRALFAALPLVASLVLSASGPAAADSEDDAPVTAGPTSHEAEEARRLFERQRWMDAAIALDRVARGDTGDDESSRQIARYRLDIALYRLELNEASLRVFSSIASRPD